MPGQVVDYLCSLGHCQLHSRAGWQSAGSHLCRHASHPVATCHSSTWHCAHELLNMQPRCVSALLPVSAASLTWYAMSKKGKWPLSAMRALIWRHCSGVGSTPVGLCAHACSRNTLPEGAACSRREAEQHMQHWCYTVARGVVLSLNRSATRGVISWCLNGANITTTGVG
jgi:hypothetical protein